MFISHHGCLHSHTPSHLPPTLVKFPPPYRSLSLIHVFWFCLETQSLTIGVCIIIRLELSTGAW